MSARRQEITTKLANARQTIVVLRSQLQSGTIEQDYWEARLNDLANLLEQVTKERSVGEQSQRLAALYEVSRVLGSSLEVDEVLNQVMDSIIQLTGAERGFLMLFEEDGPLQVNVARNIHQESLSEEQFAFSRSVIRTVAETGEQVVTTNASEDPRFASQASVVAHSLRSIQCVPLRARGEIIGVVYVDNRVRSGVFSEEDLQMLSAFASQAAIAIENARLFTRTDEALEARVEELSIMQEIDRQLNETLDYDKVMDLTLGWAVDMAGADNGALGVIDLEEGQTQVIAKRGETPAGVSALLEGRTPQDDQPGQLTVPIQREGRIIGVIALDRNAAQPFSDDAHDFVLRLADHAAIAIENAKLYEEVQRANNAKTEFISVVTHELRVPMTAIRGYADMLALADNLEDSQHRYVEMVRRNVARMGVLVSDLSDIARIESGHLSLEMEEDIDLAEALDTTLAALEGQIKQRDHQTHVEMDADLVPVHADPQRLEQIFTNLISNAYKYTPEGGLITIRAYTDNGFVRCEVTDTGIGMTPEEVDKLFTKFWRAEGRQVRDQPGTGLGLTIVKNLVEMQGGEMGVESEKGVGTTFWFTLPTS